MTWEDDLSEEDPYRDDPEGFQLLDREQYESLTDDEQWAYLKARSDAEQRRMERLRTHVRRRIGHRSRSMKYEDSAAARCCSMRERIV